QKVASEIPAAQGRGQQAQNATKNIAADMQNFLTSDVVYSQRVAPLIKQGLDDNGVQGQTISTSKSLPSLAWLSPQTVAGSIGSQGAGGTNTVTTQIGAVPGEKNTTNNKSSYTVIFQG